MQFPPKVIERAREFQEMGLLWEPKAGHYVYDETSFCRKSSPFQDRVYFILNYDYFMDQVGGVERFKAIMTWLPTWHDCREILRQYGVSDKEVAGTLRDRGAIENASELSVLYDVIAALLKRQGTEANIDARS